MKFIFVEIAAKIGGAHAKSRLQRTVREKITVQM